MPREQPRRISVSRGGLVGSVLVALVALMCVRFGFWQLSRLEQKRTRNAAAQARLHAPPLLISSALIDTAGLTYRHVRAAGAFDDQRTTLLAGHSLNGAPGVHVLTPLRIGGGAVLVNRGWLPSTNPASLAIDSIPLTAGEELAGLAVPAPRDARARADTLSTFRRVWYRPDLEEMRAHYPYELADYVIQLAPIARATGLPVRLPPPVFDEGPHLGYAIQWFSFAVIAIVGWLIVIFRTGVLRTNDKGRLR